MSQPSPTDRESYAKVLQGLTHQRGDRDVQMRAAGPKSTTLHIDWPGCGNALEILESITNQLGNHGFTAVGYLRIELDNGHRLYAVECEPKSFPSSSGLPS